MTVKNSKQPTEKRPASDRGKRTTSKVSSPALPTKPGIGTVTTMAKTTSAQALITRLPYALKYDPKPILEASKEIDERSLICVAIPVHVEAPNNGGVLIAELEKEGLFLVAKVAWHRDRGIVMNKSRRLTNYWEPIAIFSRNKNHIMNRDAPARLKKGFESRENPFDEDSYASCVGDMWAVRNDRADRRFLPQTVVLNCAQLADLQPGDVIFDPYGNPGVRKTCEMFGWKFKDGNLPNDARKAKAAKSDDTGDQESEAAE